MGNSSNCGESFARLNPDRSQAKTPALPKPEGRATHKCTSRKARATREKYRTVRMNLLANYCAVTKFKFPEAVHIVGIASEAGLPPQRSEDLIYLDASNWGPGDQTKAQKIQEELGILRTVTPGERRIYEYPVDRDGNPRKSNTSRKSPSRNSPCPCGSRKRFKRCHGKGLFTNRLK